MIFNVGERNEFEATPENALVITGDTFMSGFFVDLDDDYYFEPWEDPAFVETALHAKHEKIPIVELTHDFFQADPTLVHTHPWIHIANWHANRFKQEIEVVLNSGT